MTESEVVSRLLAEVEEAGAMNAWARARTAEGSPVSIVAVHRVLKRKEAPSKSLLTAMGLRRVVSYEVIK